MDSRLVVMNQRKQQLQHNDFADWLDAVLRSPATKIIASAAGAVIIVSFLGIWWFQSSTGRRDASWARHFEAADRAQFDGAVEPLERHAIDEGDSLARSWSRQLAADAKLKEGLAKLFSNRGEAKESLDEAVSGFQEVLTQNEPGSLIHSRAVFGHGIAMEALGNTEAAMKDYQSLVDAGPDTALGRLAQKYVDNLKMVDSADAFVERFVAHTPTPMTNSGFDDNGFNPFGPDATAPGGLRNLPDISFPEPLPDLTAPEETTAPEESTSETPGETPATETPATEDPATDPPATETPVTDPPATETPATETPQEPQTESPSVEPTAGDGSGEPSGQ